MNLRSEVNAPDDFTDFKPCDGKGEINGLNTRDKYSFSFGQESDFDTANQQMFKDFSDKFLNKNDAKTYFEILNDYQL